MSKNFSSFFVTNVAKEQKEEDLQPFSIELERLQAQYEAVVRQNRELQQENRRLLNLVSTARECSNEASYLYYHAITDPQKRANTVYKIYEDLRNAIKEVQNV